MQIGAENKKKVIAMAVLLAIGVALGIYNFKDFLWSSNASAAPSVPAAATSQPKPVAGVLPPQDTSDPRLRLDILETSRKVKHEPGRNIFTMEVATIEKIAGDVRQQPWGPPPPPTPTPIPTPPPIPINYYGFASKPGEPKKVFLQQKGAEEVYVVGLGDIVARRYRVVQIQANSVTMEDVLTNNRQQIPVTVK